MRKIVVVTDCIDIAFNEIRGAIYSNAEIDDFIIEPIVVVDNYNIVNTAFAVRLVADIYPEGTIICVIVHHLQQRAERIIGRTKDKGIVFEGTNTGAFGWLLKDFGCEEIFELYDPGFVQFGGKNIHAPNVGKSLTTPIEQLGNKFCLSRVRDVELIDGIILHIDNFGNIKFKHKFEDVENMTRFMITLNGREYKVKYYERMMNGNDGELVVYKGSSFGFSEIGVVRGNAADLLKPRVGDVVIIREDR